MVHRHLLTVCLGLALCCGCLPCAARAQDQKVAIGYYQWSTQTVNVDLGQHVSWYWVGPDTMHSVTGTSANDTSIDSDPNTSEPEHRVGDSFQVTFTVPGTYYFQCKLHPIVRGVVVVSPILGSPSDDPEPVPAPNVDLVKPTLSGVSLRPSHFTVSGTSLHYTLDKVASLDAEIWRLGPHGSRHYAGWEKWSGHIGFNQGRFAVRGPHFRPAPGSYEALLRATDTANNVSATLRLPFVIARGRGP